jgi:broad specificity phosphatase PhoE
MCKIDCSVTALGRQQGKEAGRALSRDVKTIDLLLISPLRRALQTASFLLESFPEAPRTQICKEATEIMVDPCDIGSTPDVLVEEFPALDFSHLEKFWWHGRKSPEETWDRMRQRQGLEEESEVEKRVASLKDFLRDQKGETIAIVCHSETIWWLTSKVKNGERFGTWTKNGEIVDITNHI